MKSTGIIRRIDDLGRVVVPKEVRRTLRIRENDPLEVFILEDMVVFKKYSYLNTVRDFANNLCDSFFTGSNIRIAVTDMDSVIATSKEDKNLRDVRLGEHLVSTIKRFQSYTSEGEIEIIHVNGDTSAVVTVVIPIIVEGELMGSVVALSDTNEVNDDVYKAAKTAATFISRYMDVT